MTASDIVDALARCTSTLYVESKPHGDQFWGLRSDIAHCELPRGVGGREEVKEEGGQAPSKTEPGSSKSASMTACLSNVVLKCRDLWRDLRTHGDMEAVHHDAPALTVMSNVSIEEHRVTGTSTSQRPLAVAFGPQAVTVMGLTPGASRFDANRLLEELKFLQELQTLRWQLSA